MDIDLRLTVTATYLLGPGPCGLTGGSLAVLRDP